jgi:glycosyltransferase involved in cell wall biosynthesis
MPEPVVSVVIPTYNMAGWVTDAVQSALAQTFREYEIIVVDDGSTDDTEAALAPWRDQIRYIRQENMGQSVATNTGVLAARAPYVAFLDADDLWMPEKLARQMPGLLADDEIGLSCTDFSIQSPTGAVVPSFFQSGKGFAEGHVFDEMLDHCWVANPTAIVPRRVFDAVGFFYPTLNLGQDFHQWLRIAHTWKVTAVPDVLCRVRQRPDGRRPFESAYRSAIRTRESLLHAIPGLSARRQRVVRHQIAELAYRIGHRRILEGRTREARDVAREALRWNRFSVRATAMLGLSYCPPAPVHWLYATWRRLRARS